MTINELLALMRIVKERVTGLEELRGKSANRTRWYSGGAESKVDEPQYDVKAVDRKITELQAFLFRADAAIKQSNASTKVTITIDVDGLLAPLA